MLAGDEVLTSNQCWIDHEIDFYLKQRTALLKLYILGIRNRIKIERNAGWILWEIWLDNNALFQKCEASRKA